MSWTLKVRDTFQAAHFLREYKGKCEQIHGHTFQVEAQIKIDTLDATGIGIDFAEIKKCLSEMLPDHTLLNDIYSFNPTAENLARHFFKELQQHFPILSVTVWESKDASATYTEDQ